jgi:hypothetical protein
VVAAAPLRFSRYRLTILLDVQVLCTFTSFYSLILPVAWMPALAISALAWAPAGD